VQIHGIGIDINDERVHGDLEVLRDELEYFQRCGFDTVELTTSGLYFIFNGDLNRERTRKIQDVLSRYPFHYTLHLPDVLNLSSSPDPELDLAIFSSCIDFASAVGARVLVYHSGQNFYNLESPELRAEAVERESSALADLAEKAQKSGILITVENTNPEAEELNLIEERGLSKEQIRLLHPALCLDAIGKQVQRIGAPNLGLTLDPGHLNLAVEITGDPFLSSIEDQAHLVRHLHLNDNFGRNPHPRYSRMEQTLYGRADCHLPLGMGSMPIKEILTRLGDFKGFIIFEIRPEYREYLADSIAKLSDYLAAISV
jgi:sugar phosphate isomerase/epimerase